MKKGMMVLSIVVLLVLSFVSGYLISSSEMFGGGGDAPDQVEVPVWKEGMYWVYAYSTPDVDHTLAKTVVATIDDEDYNLGIDNLVDAQRHAVLNYNPMLGRITKDHLGIYEEGEPQTVLLFPLEVGKTWRFTMLGNEGLDTKVVSEAAIVASASAAESIPAMPAGSASGPTITKSLYMTSSRLTPWSASINASSLARACTRSTSASPCSPSANACPVPTATTSTVIPLSSSKTGKIASSRPES